VVRPLLTYSCPPLVPALTRSFQRIQSGSRGPFYPIRIAWQILDILSEAREVPAVETSLSGREQAEVCRELIDSDYGNDLSIAELARELGIDRTTLYRQFRALYGASPQEHLLATRMAQAEEMLQRTRMPIKQVALRSGFRNPDYFSRAFRQHHGVSPGAWRRERATSGAGSARKNSAKEEY
jgi:AraC-like DNA-binding protein